MPKLERPDLSLHYEVTGNGPPLLLLAGFMSDHASWTPLVPLLAGHFSCIAPDNRTTGQTTPWDAPVSVKHMADDAVALMDHLGHDRFHIVGHSMGVTGCAFLPVSVVLFVRDFPFSPPQTFVIFTPSAPTSCLPTSPRTRATHQTHTLHDDTTGPEGGDCMLWLAGVVTRPLGELSPTHANCRKPALERLARHSLFDRYMKAQLRLAGGRRKPGRHGFSSDSPRGSLALPYICATCATSCETATSASDSEWNPI